MLDTHVYAVYEERRVLTERSREEVSRILSEKEELFRQTQPKGVAYDKDRVSGGLGSNAMETYVIALERAEIPKRLEEAKAILAEREALLRNTEAVLRASMDTYDRVYVLRYLEHKSVNRIAADLMYSESHIYWYLHRISNSVRR